MAWRLIRPVIMAPNVTPDADGIAAIKRAVEARATCKLSYVLMYAACGKST